MRFLASLALLGPILTLAAPSKRVEPFVVHEKRDGPPHMWKRHSPAVRDQVIPIRIGLKQRNLEHAARYIDDIADPDSPNYGKHWTAEEVAKTFAPTKTTSDRTIEWLTSNGIQRDRLRHSVGRNWIEFSGTVAEAEELLSTTYHVYEHVESGGFRMACDAYSLPENMREHIDFVMPTIQLDGLKPVANALPASLNRGSFTGLNGVNNCSELVTIDCLRALYQFPEGKTAHPSNVMGIGEWDNFLFQQDLPAFFRNYTRPQIPSDVVPEFISIDGGQRANKTIAQAEGSFFIGESALDFQTSYSIIWPQNIRLYQNGDGINVDSVGTFNIFLDALDGSYCTYLGGDEPYLDPSYPDDTYGGWNHPVQCGGAPKSNVISVSYGQIEGALPVFYQTRQCHEWMKLALQGVTAVFAAGDSGVANRYNAGYNNSCINPQYGYVTSGPDGTKFSPSFPGNCPYITTVGATELRSNNLTEGERAVNVPDKKNPLNDFYSGGGFSAVFDRPSWQNKAVGTYLDKYAPKYNDSVFNHAGRGFPDVSALGWQIVTVILNETYTSGGTSASAPIFASIITLINEERLSAGKKPVGFINPIIYKHPEMFNDITIGSNPGCGTDGFPAAPGWDPVTGMGTPNYPKMLEVFMSLP